MKDLAEQVFDHEAYKQVLSMIPGRFVDHMPDMYLDPLMSMLAKTEPLQLEIIAARGLRDADWFGKSDPYVHVKLKGKSELCAKTHHVNGSLEPVWDFVTPVHNYEEGDDLEFEVYDKNLGMKDDFLGRASLEGSRFHKWGWEGELQLSDTGHKGESFIRIRASWRQKGKPKKA
uniref:C2 domain-containing protein n=1 Tax=Alexandrium andersonii TaxID=327968 RepID=A0A7S2GFV4_9DINO|mmetsp:Transcript_49422/g.111956  ORF Transcript_49422/g.111956 Transcript_49422/m.111956 type:complete len:174 (+) Transcript_49422:3-524(+)